ncbi:MAG: hypothetical protein KJZ70_18090, partial [Bryobacterales bacterium]|nr:hypothetical protein [Bryobacterales bacterium]
MTPASIRSSANSAASLSSSSRASASAQAGRAPREEESARGVAEFGGYLAMWMETRIEVAAATPRQFADRVPLPPPGKTTEDPVRHSRFEPSSRLGEANEDRRQNAGNRMEGVARQRTGLANERQRTGLANERQRAGLANERQRTGLANERQRTGLADERSRTGLADSRPRANSVGARAPVRGNAPARLESGAPAHRSALWPARAEMADASRRNSDSQPASDASRDAREAAADASRPAQERTTQGGAASAGNPDEGPIRFAGGGGFVEETEENPRAWEPGDQENSDALVASGAPVRDSAATGAPAAVPGHSIPAAGSSGQAIAASGEAVPLPGGCMN